MFLVLDVASRLRDVALNAILALCVGIITALCTRLRAIIRERRADRLERRV
jgi:hypothetical protein